MKIFTAARTPQVTSSPGYKIKVAPKSKIAVNEKTPTCMPKAVLKLKNPYNLVKSKEGEHGKYLDAVTLFKVGQIDLI